MDAHRRLRTARPKTSEELSREYPISVVIPARNCAAVLEKCLEALTLNELAGGEVLVVDDASADETPQQAEAFAAAAGFPLQVVQLDRQGGPAVARNAGLEIARCPHVLFLDSDIVLPRDALSWLRESLDLYSHRPEVVGVLGTYSEEVPHPDFWSNYKNLYTCFLYATTDTLSPFIHTPIFCVEKELLTEVGGFDPDLATAEDFRLGIVLGSAGYRFVIDRRIRGIHLKAHTFAGILLEDQRRICDLRKVTLSAQEQQFSYRAHRWSRLLSVALPGPILGLFALCFWIPAFWPSALLLVGIFYLANAKFLRYCQLKRGWFFSFKAALFLFLEMLWAEYAIVRSLRG